MTVRGHVTEVVEAGPIGTARFWLQPKGDRKRLIVSNLDVKVSVGELLEVTGWEDPDGYVNAERIQNVPPPQPPEPVAPHPPRVEPERPPLPKPEPQSRRTSKLPKWVLVLGSLIIIAALGWWLLKSALKPTIGDTIRINPTSPVAGHRFTVALQLKRAQQVTLTPDATPSGQPGEYTFPQGLSDSTDLEVVATNIFGSTPKKFHIEVQPAPVGKKPSNVILSVNPLHVHRGDQVTIRWNALNADKVVLRGLGTEIELTPPSGGSLPHPIQQQTDLQLIASNSAGETPSRPVTVTLEAPGSAPGSTSGGQGANGGGSGVTVIRVAPNVQASKLIRKTDPVYPPLAQQARIQGEVRLTVEINQQGGVSNAQVVRGHPFLAQAARDAVMKWVYSPTLVNGRPVEVVTEVDLNFTLPQNLPSASAEILTPAALRAPAPPEYNVRFTTSKGDFVIEVHRDWAPNGADRFYNLARAGYFDGVRFFRAVKGFMVQFGISPRVDVNHAWLNANISDDKAKPGISNKRGFVSFASAGPNTRTTQVFINLADNSRFDSMGFTPFGEVEGMETVDKFYMDYGEAPTNDQPNILNGGEAYTAKRWPNTDKILTARIEGAPAAR